MAELKRLLRQRVDGESELGRTLVELVVRRLKDQGYLNDAKYAAAYSAFRRDNEKFGRRRVITDLKVKGSAASAWKNPPIKNKRHELFEGSCAQDSPRKLYSRSCASGM